MARGNEYTMKEALEALLKAYRLKDGIVETKLILSWESVVGKMIADHTKDLKIANKTLFVKLDSDAIRNELLYAKEKLIKSLNAKVKEEVITNIVFR